MIKDKRVKTLNMLQYFEQDYSEKEILESIPPKDINKQNEDGDTLLHISLREDRIEHAKILIERGANFTIPNKEGETPFTISATKGFIDILKLMHVAFSIQKSINDTPETINNNLSNKYADIISEYNEESRAIIKKILIEECNKNGTDILINAFISVYLIFLNLMEEKNSSASANVIDAILHANTLSEKINNLSAFNILNKELESFIKGKIKDKERNNK